MWKTVEGSTGRLIQLCLAYFSLYAIFGVATKYFTGKTAIISPPMSDMGFLIWSTLGGSIVCLAVVFALGWYKGKSERNFQVGPLKIPVELAYIIPSGICTAVVIPTTTLMYMLLKSVMVAMVIMRASVIVISRFVDEAQIRQGILDKRVYWEENVAVLFAIAAACSQIFLAKSGDFDFLTNVAAMSVLGAYITAYAIRIYLMNYYKNTRPAGVSLNNNWYFSIEQIAATVTMVAVVIVLLNVQSTAAPILAFQAAIATPHPAWLPATGMGGIYGLVAFVSVFIFMFKGRTATFTGLVNRLTSLVAGTTATLISFFLFGGRFPSVADWASLGLILIAVGFLSMAERKRTKELTTTPPTPEAAPVAAEAKA